MDTPEQRTIGDARRLAHELQALQDVDPPASLLPRVLVTVGLGDAFWQLETPIGPVFVAYNAQGVSALAPAGDAAVFTEAFRTRFGRPAYEIAQPPARLARAVSQRLSGDARSRVPFDLRGRSTFERSVLAKAQEIPRGEVRPYGWIAGELGRPKAARAVGSALGRNPIPLLIPCHRVVRGDGRPGDYVFGSAAKHAMLAEEGVPLDQIERDAQAGTRFLGSDTTGIFCYPTCRNARRITPQHRVPFTSAPAATTAGYRPCHVCRPVVTAS